MTARNDCGRHAKDDRRRRVEFRRPKAANETRRAKSVPPAAPAKALAEEDGIGGTGSGGGGEEPPSAGSDPELVAAAVGPDAAWTAVMYDGESGAWKVEWPGSVVAERPAAGVPACGAGSS